MGWESCPGIKTPKEWAEKELDKMYGDTFSVADRSVRGNQVYYAVYSKKTEQTTGCVAIFQRENKVLWVKCIPESHLPYYYNCPARILNRLSPVDNENSMEWRNRCFELIQLKKKFKEATP